MNIKKYEWPDLPKGIPNIKYDNIENIKSHPKNLEQLLLDINMTTKIYKKILNEPLRIIPPYKVKCSHPDGCIKDASFMYQSKYYCWFHKYYQKN